MSTFLPACCTDPVYLDSHFSPTLRTGISACKFDLISVNDIRKNKKSLGEIGRRRVKNERVIDWLTNGLKSVGIAPQEGDEPCKCLVDVEIDLIALHGRSISTSMSCNIVLRAKFCHNGVLLEQKIYRGCNVNVNWVSGEDEIGVSFDRALKDALVEISKDANAICRRCTIDKHQL